MGFKHDQRLPSEIHEEFVEAQAVSTDEPLPPYTEVAYEPAAQTHNVIRPYNPAAMAAAASSASSLNPSLATGQPTPSMSTTSLATLAPQDSITPSIDSSDPRRILLLVYIHGFVGDETTFQSFPAHVHTMLTKQVSETHVVHTKVYPRFKTRKNISVVRDQFSAWLTQRESPRTDIVLIGHSMGGIVSAEVALMPGSGTTAGFKHRLLGTLNLDVPFLGMHPKVIGAGISSIFAGAPADTPARQTPYLNADSEASNSSVSGIALMPIEPEQSVSTSASASATGSITSLPSSLSPAFSQHSRGLEMPAHNDMYFNPAYANDQRVPTRKAFDNISHFVNKHAGTDGLLKAGASYVSSHFEFGGTMADYRGLDRRYKRLRALERPEYGDVHFINFFTTCEGRPKKEKKEKKPAKSSKSSKAKKQPKNVDKSVAAAVSSESLVESAEESKLKMIESGDHPTSDLEELTLTVTDPVPVTDSASEGEDTPSTDESFQDAHDYADEQKETIEGEKGVQGVEDDSNGLPPVPAEPIPPPAFDASKYSEKDALKLAEKQYSRQLKSYQQACKERDRVIREREKLLRKREERKKRDAAKAQEKLDKEAARLVKAQSKETTKEEQKRRADEKNAEKEAQKKLKQLEKEAMREKKEADKAAKARLKEEPKRDASAPADSMTESDDDDADSGDDNDGSDENIDKDRAGSISEMQPTRLKRRKLRTFCLTPPKAKTARRRDWRPVFVADVDLVEAHCGIFKTRAPHYEHFVETVVAVLADWADDVPR